MRIRGGKISFMDGLNLLNNIKRNLQTIAMAALLFFVQGSAIVAYGSGVSINFSSIPGMIQTPETTGTPIGTIPSNTTSGMQSNKTLAADLNSEPRPYVEVTNIPSATTSNQNLNAPSSSASCPNCYNTSEHTAELLVPSSFGTLPESESMLPAAEAYSVTVCLSYNGKAAPDCREKYTPSQTGEKLAAVMFNKYAKSAVVRPFKVVMPSFMSSDQQVQTLRQVEKKAIDIIESIMLKNSGREKQDVFAEEIRLARQEAESGTNWSQNQTEDRLTYVYNNSYHVGQALDIINNMIISSRKVK